MSTAKNRRIKERRKQRKNEKRFDMVKQDFRQKDIEKRRNTASLNHAMSNKSHKNNQGLVDKFKRLFK